MQPETRQLVDEIRTDCLRDIEMRYCLATLTKDRLPYHNISHTQMVYDRLQRLVEAISRVRPDALTKRECIVIPLAAVAHDEIIFNWIVGILKTLPDGQERQLRIRKRRIGDSEKASIEALHTRMIAQNILAGARIFTVEDIDFCSRAIMLTVPEFKHGTVVQTIRPETPLKERLVALADLGGVGMDPYFRAEGDALLCEESPMVAEAVFENYYDPEDEWLLKNEIVRWSRTQCPFARGRQEWFPNDLAGLDHEIAEAIRSCFPYFAQSIQESRSAAERRENMTLQELIADMRETLRYSPFRHFSLNS